MQQAIGKEEEMKEKYFFESWKLEIIKKSISHLSPEEPECTVDKSQVWEGFYGFPRLFNSLLNVYQFQFHKLAASRQPSQDACESSRIQWKHTEMNKQSTTEHNAGNFKVFFEQKDLRVIRELAGRVNIWAGKSQSRVPSDVKGRKKYVNKFQPSRERKDVFLAAERARKSWTWHCGPLKDDDDRRSPTDIFLSSWILIPHHLEFRLSLSFFLCCVRPKNESFDGYKHPLRALSERGKKRGFGFWHWRLIFPILCCVWNAIEENHSVWFMRRWTLMHASLLVSLFYVFFLEKYKNFSTVYIWTREEHSIYAWKCSKYALCFKRLKNRSSERSRDWNSRFVVPHQESKCRAHCRHKGVRTGENV